MADQDELARLQAERHRLLSMIAYHERDSRRMDFRAPAWFIVVAIGIVVGIGVSIVAGILAGQISSSGIIFSVVGLLLLAYILTKEIGLFGISFRLGDVFAGYPTGQPAGEPEARQRLSECEARIVKLMEGRR